MIEEKYIEQARGIIRIIEDGSRDTQVLSTTTEGSGEPEAIQRGHNRQGVGLVNGASSSPTGDTKDNTWPPELFKLDLPDVAKAKRYRVRANDQTVYVMVTEGDEGEPLEIFTKFPYEADPVWNTLCRQISLSLRYGIPVIDIVKQLDKSVVGVGDMSAKISRVLKGYLNVPEQIVELSKVLDDANIPTKDRIVKKMGGSLCPKCHHILVPEGGCFSCKNCGWEKCS